MSIRLATVADAGEIRALVLSLSHFYLAPEQSGLPVWLLDTLTLSEFEGRLNGPDHYNYVFEMDGAIAGYLCFKGKNYLYHLFVAERHQGQGVAKQLWQYAIAALKEKSYLVNSSLFAVPVYEKLGFRKVADKAYREGIGYQPMRYDTGQ